MKNEKWKKRRKGTEIVNYKGQTPHVTHTHTPWCERVILIWNVQCRRLIGRITSYTRTVRIYREQRFSEQCTQPLLNSVSVYSITFFLILLVKQNKLQCDGEYCVCAVCTNHTHTLTHIRTKNNELNETKERRGARLKQKRRWKKKSKISIVELNEEN